MSKFIDYLIDKKLTFVETKDSLVVEGPLDLQGSGVFILPDNLIVKGSLYLRFTKISRLPKGLYVEKNLFVGGCTLYPFPSDFKILGEVYGSYEIVPNSIQFITE